MITCFDNAGVKIAEFNPTGPLAGVRKSLCEACDWLRKADLECWHPSQKCATRTRPWQFSACPGDFWNAPAAGLQSHGKLTAKLVLRIPGEDWTGFGQTANQIALALLARGIEFVVICTDYSESKCPLPDAIRRRIVSERPPGLPVLTIGSIQKGTAGADQEAWLTLWESTEAPPAFRLLADACRLIITASEWGRATLARSTASPVIRVPLCIDPAAWPERPMPGGPFTFLCAGRLAHGGVRKGLQTVIAAFLAEFPREDVRLRIKGWADCKMEIPDDPRIDLVDRYLTPAELAEWYASGHVFVSAATAEGWGMHQLQAMCSGRPLIAAPYSSMSDYLDKSTGYPVKHHEVPCAGAAGYAGSWAEIDIASLREKMRDAYHRRPALLRRGAAAARAASRYTPDATAVGIIRSLHRVGLLRQKTYYHAGDIGDVIYSLPTVKALGGGILHLGPQVNLPAGLAPRQGISQATCDSLRPLLESQPYIHQVVYSPSVPPVTYDLNRFRLYWRGHGHVVLNEIWARRRYSHNITLAWMHAAQFGVEFDESNPWLSVQSDGHHWRYIFARSARYHNPRFPWREIVRRFGSEAAFVGTFLEHRDFVRDFGEVGYLPTSNFASLAVTIGDAQCFIGNASSPLAVAIGLGQRCVVECRHDDHPVDVEFDRENLFFYKIHENTAQLFSHIEPDGVLQPQPGAAKAAASHRPS